MLHQKVCSFVLSNPSRLCIMGRHWSFPQTEVNPQLQTASTTSGLSPLPFSAAPTSSVFIRIDYFSIGAALKLRLPFDLRMDKMQLKYDIINGLLICLIRRYEEVSLAPGLSPAPSGLISHMRLPHFRSTPHPLTPASLSNPPPFPKFNNLRRSAWKNCRKANNLNST